MRKLTKGPGMVIGPEEGDSYWQPGPHHGYMTVKLSPFNIPSNLFSMGIQVIPAGCSIRKHGHARNDELLFVYEGEGTATVDGKSYKIETGSTVFVGRYVEHGVVNDGGGDLKLMWMIFPPGLESVVEATGKPRKPGEPPPEKFGRPDNMTEILERAWYATPEQMRDAL